MATTSWGRKETIIWPPHVPIFTYSAILTAIFCTAVFALQGFRAQSILQRTYTTAYIESQVGAWFHHSGTYRLIYVGGAKKPPRHALPLDLVEQGQTTMPDGKTVSATLSEVCAREGYRFFYAAAPRVYADASMYRWLRSAIFEDKGIVQTYAVNLYEGLGMLALMLFFAVRRDVQRFKELKYGRRLRGPELLTPKAFNKTVKGQGIGFKTTEMKQMMRIPLRNEAQHFPDHRRHWPG